jgi:phenylpropionate dioxygenase-like ring-hydroxylating dioxygenase large terminal subunit
MGVMAWSSWRGMTRVLFVFHAEFYEHGHSAHQATQSNSNEIYDDMVSVKKGIEDRIKDKFYGFKVGQVLEIL